MSNLVVRGMATSNTVVTAGLGPAAGTLFTQALSGIITMAGALATVFIPGGADDSQKNQGGTAIDIDIGVN